MQSTWKLLALAALAGAAGTWYASRRLGHRAATTPDTDTTSLIGNAPAPAVADHGVPNERYRSSKGFAARS